MNENMRQSNHEIFEPAMFRALQLRSSQVDKERSISLEPFIKLYGMDTVKEDYAKIAGKIALHNEKTPSPAEKMGFIFESAFLEMGSNNNWFGPDSELVHTAKFDDIENGVDMIATVPREISDSAHHMAIASDLTYSQPGSVGKLNRIVNSIHAGKLAEMKYFHSDVLGFTGAKFNIPRTVIGLDVRNLNSFLKNWIREPELEQRQYGALILNQIKTQSGGFAKLSSNIHGFDHPVTKAYRRSMRVMSDILDNEYQEIAVPEDSISKAITSLSNRLREENK